jgi:hypothetical protein
MPDLDLIKQSEHGCARLAEPVRPGPAASLEKVEELGPADSRLAQYCAKCARWKFVSMYRHYCLPAGIIPVPQEMMRPLGSDHLEAGRSSAAMTARPDTAGSALMRARRRPVPAG